MKARMNRHARSMARSPQSSAFSVHLSTLAAVSGKFASTSPHPNARNLAIVVASPHLKPAPRFICLLGQAH
jgi:hypothetical protein